MDSNKEILRREVSPALLDELPENLNPVLRRVYAARGVGLGSLDTSLAALIPISKLAGTDAAAERLALAHRNDEQVLVVGDFDADGATATALVMTCLRAFGFAQPAYLVPDREKFGYGLSAGIVAKAVELYPKLQLIVTVDNGISSHAGVAVAQEHGIEVIVTDHHLPGETLPAASVIVNPNAADDDFPSKNLAGVGVAFYVMAALGQRLAADGCINAAEARAICAGCLDLVALGTVADLVPLDLNNRVLVAQGLGRIRSGGSRPGIAALFAAANRRIADAAASDLGFAIAPRLNAAGRLDDMSVGIDCLLAGTAAHASKRAEQLSQLNDERRELQARMQADAELHLDALPLEDDSQSGLCLYDPGWHAGVVGLVATRIKDRINRPVIAFAPGAEDGSLKGSGRSVRGVHMRDVLVAIDARRPGLILRFGGHAMAAGLSLAPDALAEFTTAFQAEVAAHADQIDDSGRLWSDGNLSAEELGLSLAEQLRTAGPWGQGFPEPVFDGRFEVLSQRIVGERHLKLELMPSGGKLPVNAIAFNHPDLLVTEVSPECIAVYKLDVNEFRRNRSHQLVVEHIERV